MSAWFKTWPSLKSIEEVDVVHFTDKTVTLAEGRKRRRANRMSEFCAYFPTREEAVRYALDYYDRQIEIAEKRVTAAHLEKRVFCARHGVDL